MEIGDRLERYVIEAQVGAGGMGEVFRARHEVLGSLHAIKVLRMTGPIHTERLLREARTQARLSHRNVLRVTDFLQVDGLHAIVMEYIEDGLNLEGLLRRQKLSLAEIDRLGCEIIRGVQAAHDAGLIHRDLKPANVMIADTDEGLTAKITDFGLVRDPDDARLTQTGLAMGTPGFAAPEQVRGVVDIDHRADLFALGATLYELASGRRAFGGSDLLEVLNRSVEGTFIDPRLHCAGIPDHMVAAIDAALVVDREHRVDSCASLLQLWRGDNGGSAHASPHATPMPERESASAPSTSQRPTPPTYVPEPDSQPEMVAGIAEAGPASSTPGGVFRRLGALAIDALIFSILMTPIRLAMGPETGLFVAHFTPEESVDGTVIEPRRLVFESVNVGDDGWTLEGRNGERATFADEGVMLTRPGQPPISIPNARVHVAATPWLSIMAFLGVIYSTAFLAWSAATPGKLALSLEVVDRDRPTQGISVMKALLRSAFAIVSFFLCGLGYLWVLTHAERVTWHDAVSRTRVVHRPRS